MLPSGLCVLSEGRWISCCVPCSPTQRSKRVDAGAKVRTRERMGHAALGQVGWKYMQRNGTRVTEDRRLSRPFSSLTAVTTRAPATHSLRPRTRGSQAEHQSPCVLLTPWPEADCTEHVSVRSINYLVGSTGTDALLPTLGIVSTVRTSDQHPGWVNILRTVPATDLPLGTGGEGKDTPTGCCWAARVPASSGRLDAPPRIGGEGSVCPNLRAKFSGPLSRDVSWGRGSHLGPQTLMS